MVKLYASLTGPLLGLYFPVGADEAAARRDLNESKLARLWCSVYPEKIVDEQIQRWGGVKLPDDFASRL